MKTLQQIKDEHAKELGFTDYDEMFAEALHTGVDYCVDAVAIRYANHKLDEASKKAKVNKVKLVHNNTTKYVYVVSTKSIIDLKDKL